MAAPRTAPSPPHTACLLHIPFPLPTPPLLHRTTTSPSSEARGGDDGTTKTTAY
uniref:Uncharacterized protein n=1 Tax=Aegilops tauschii TaxID=37682 RepID=M8BCV8_AEGTA